MKKTALLLLLLISSCALGQTKRKTADVAESPSGDNLIGLNEMSTANLKEGDVCHVLGDSAIGDGGESYYSYLPSSSSGDVGALGGGFWDEIGSNSSPVMPSDNLPISRQGKAVVFLYEGQSNMLGAAIKTTYDFYDYPLSNMYQLSRGFTELEYSGDTKYNFIRAFQPIQNASTGERDDSRYVSWGFYFARKYAEEHPNEDVYIVASGRGGTGFSDGEWAEGGRLRERGAVETINTLKRLRVSYGEVDFGGLLWHQGEDDTNNATNANAYEANLIAFFNERRQEIGEGNFPIIVGTMTSNLVDTTPERITVTAVHRGISNLIPNAATAEMSDLTNQWDNSHFGADDLETAGKDRYYNAYIGLVNPEVYPVEKIFEISADSEAVNIEGVSAVVSGNSPALISEGEILFDGTGFYQMGAVHPINTPYTKIVTFLHYTNIEGTGDNNQGLIANYNDTNQFGINWSVFAGDIVVNGNSGVGAVITDTSHSYFGKWSTLAVVYDGTKMRLYDETAEITNADHSDITDALGTLVTVGSRANAGTEFKGRMAFAGLYTGAMDLQEIQAVHNKYVPTQHQVIDLQSGLTVDYQMADALDSSGNGNNVTNTISLPSFASGIATFGTGDVLISPINSDEMLSYVARFKTSSTATAFLTIPSDNGSDRIYLNGVNAYFTTGGNCKSGGIAPQTLSDDQWHTLCVTYDPANNECMMYIDGKFVAGDFRDVGKSASPIRIGKSPSSTGQFIGEIDWVKMYDRPLNYSEATTITN